MKQGFDSVDNQVGENGNPAGGSVMGTGIEIDWQRGPLGRDGDRIKPNGAFVEDVIEAARQRIAFYQEAQDGKFRCRENAIAITKLEEALLWLNKRTMDREGLGPKAGDEGVTLATCNADWKYMQACVTCNCTELGGMKKDELERTLLHELLHAVVNEMREWEGGNGLHHEERVVTHLTNVVSHLLK